MFFSHWCSHCSLYHCFSAIYNFTIDVIRFTIYGLYGDKEKKGPAHPEGIVGGDDLIPVPVDVLNPLLFATHAELKQLRLMNGLNAQFAF
jgi:hypothetical protein